MPHQFQPLFTVSAKNVDCLQSLQTCHYLSFTIQTPLKQYFILCIDDNKYNFKIWQIGNVSLSYVYDVNLCMPICVLLSH